MLLVENNRTKQLTDFGKAGQPLPMREMKQIPIDPTGLDTAASWNVMAGDGGFFFAS